ncbi:hypothetical protein ig2599ANME_0996 [groundwater metagenome]
MEKFGILLLGNGSSLLYNKNPDNYHDQTRIFMSEKIGIHNEGRS